jgi:hypothetical protein
MSSQQNWALKGVYYECCRIEGHCPLWFGRDLWDEPCKNLATYEIKEGHIGGVDMRGITIMQHADGIGPKAASLAGKGIREGAAYISDHATAEQRKILEPFVTTHLGAERWVKTLGVKYVKISINHQDRTYRITMPFGEQQFTLTVGGDGKTPIRMENARNKALSDIKFCNTDVWKYRDYGKNLEFHNTSGEIADFNMQGTL